MQRKASLSQPTTRAWRTPRRATSSAAAASRLCQRRSVGRGLPPPAWRGRRRESSMPRGARARDSPAAAGNAQLCLVLLARVVRSWLGCRSGGLLKVEPANDRGTVANPYRFRVSLVNRLLAEEIELGLDHELLRGAVAVDSQSAHEHDGHPFGLPAREIRGSRDLVRDRDAGRPQLVADAVRRSAQVEDRLEARDADRHIRRPLPERASERVGDEDADLPRGQFADAVAG